MEIEGLDELNINAGEPEEDNTAEEVDAGSEQTTEGDEEAEGSQTDNDSSQESTEEGSSSEPGNDENDSGPKDSGEEGEEKEDLSGIEQYLSQFNIEGGMIDFKTGDRIHFNELDPKKQVEVLTKLHTVSTKDIEDRYGLEEDEIGLINYIRQQEGTVEEIIDNLATQKAQMYIAAQSVGDANIEEMDADSIYRAFLLKSNSAATAEQLESDLETAKKMNNYEKVVETIKQNMIKEQKQAVTQQQLDSQKELVDEIENQRKEVVDVVSKMDSIDGLSINDGIKNDVLDLILNVDDDGDSLFMTEVFSDPEKLFKAAFWYKNGTDIISAREEYWKKEKSAAYKRGQQEASSSKKTFSASDVKTDKNKTTPHYNEPNDIVSFDDIQNI